MINITFVLIILGGFVSGFLINRLLFKINGDYYEIKIREPYINHFKIEIFSTVLFGISYMVIKPTNLFFYVFLAVFLLIILFDWINHYILEFFSIPLIFLSIISNVSIYNPIDSLKNSIIGFGIFFLMMLLIYYISLINNSAMGFGDVMLFSSFGAFFHKSQLDFVIQALIFLLGYSILYIIIKKIITTIKKEKFTIKDKIPLAPALGLAFYTTLILQIYR